MLNLGVPFLSLPSQLGFDCITLILFYVHFLCPPYDKRTKRPINVILQRSSCTASKIPETILSYVLNSRCIQLYRNTLPGFSFGDVLPLTHRNVYCTITVLSSNCLDCLTATSVSS